MGSILWLIFLGLVVIVLQWYAGVKAREQIEDHIASIGGTVLSIERALRSNTVLGSPPKNGYVVTYLSRDGVELTRVIARVTKKSWGQYRIENASDMREYMKMYFTVASDFDQDPAIHALLQKADRQPGEFARAMESLPAERISALKQAGTPPGAKSG